VARLLESYREHRRRPAQVPPPPLPSLPRATTAGRYRLGSVGPLLLAALLGAAGATAFRSRPACEIRPPVVPAAVARVSTAQAVATNAVPCDACPHQAVHVAVVGGQPCDTEGAAVVIVDAAVPHVPGLKLLPRVQQVPSTIHSEWVEKGRHWWHQLGVQTVRVLLKGVQGNVLSVFLAPEQWQWQIWTDGAGGFVLWPLPADDSTGNCNPSPT
jgi:hypothetical protein